jgi:DNA polymerase-1
VYNPRDEGTWYDEGGVQEKFGVRPDQVVDVLALMGDTIDNVKGVPGIGEKGARELIAAYGTLDALMAGAAGVPQKRYREALTTHADSARQSRELLRIHTDVPIEVDLTSLRYAGSSRERCYELFTRLGFRSLVMEYAPTAGTIAKQYALVRTPEALDSLVASLRESGRFACRVLTDVPAPMRAAIVGLAFSASPRAAHYVPLGHRTLDSAQELGTQAALAALGPLFEDPRVLKIGHDVKTDMIVLARHGIALAGVDADTMIASYLLDATRSSHPLEETALEHVGYRALTEEEVCGKGARAISIADVPVSAALDYASERADLALQLAAPLLRALDEQELTRLYRELEMPLVPVLAAIERAGIRLDAAVLGAQSQQIERELATRSAAIYQLAGGEFNVNSPRQLSEILFEKLKLRRAGRARETSTAVEVLEELALQHDLPRQVLEWRALMKLKGTYIDALPQLVHPGTGRVHTSFNQAVAATGRLSSSDPNLQNIPIRTEPGREIRRAFVADPGHLLISADYSQIELRVLAHLSGDESLAAAFLRGDDIHDQTAFKVFGATSGLGPHELRRRAKIINYALLYGKTAFTLARDIGVTPEAAQVFIDAYFAGFPRVRAFIDETLARARATGVVKTMFGRRRLVPDLTSRNGQIRAAAERATVNMPIQGTAADILKRAMIDIHAALEAHNVRAARPTRMILTVHDELLFEAPEPDAGAIAHLVRDRMEHAVTLAVPLTVDVGIGRNWREAKS